MFTGRSKRLKAQDILLLLKIICLKGKSWRIIDLAYELDLSPSEVSMGLERLKLSCLINDSKKEPDLKSVEECLLGLKYFYPAVISKVAKGIPTAQSFLYSSNTDINEITYVWESEMGHVKGTSISPIYESAPSAALKDLKLHHLLAIIDIIRIGDCELSNVKADLIRIINL